MDPVSWATVALVVMPAALALAAFCAGWGSRGSVADAAARVAAVELAALTVERDEWKRRVGALEADLVAASEAARRVVDATRARAEALADPDDRRAVERLLALRDASGRPPAPGGPAAPAGPSSAGPAVDGGSPGVDG